MMKVNFLRQGSIFVIALVSICLLSSCGTDPNQDSDENNEPPDEQTTKYDLAILVSPNDAGSVEPSSGTFEEGSEIEINASANEGWIFNNWTGDLNSNDNPLILSMNDDKSLTANFLDMRSDYRVEMTLKDDLGEIHLELGQKSNFSELLLQAPPPPPDGALYAAFEKEGQQYIKDYRPIVKTDLKWELFFNTGNGENLRLEWILEESTMDGTLSIKDNMETFEIDMKTSSTLKLDGIEDDHLIIKYENE